MNVPPKRQSTLTGLNGVKCQINNIIFLAVQSLLCMAGIHMFSFNYGPQ
jgi:hypothetical protein